MYDYFNTTTEETYRAQSANEISLRVRTQARKMALLNALYRPEAASAIQRENNLLKALVSFLTGSRANRQYAGASHK